MPKKIESEQPDYGQAGVLDAAKEAIEQATLAPPPGPEAVAVQEALAGDGGAAAQNAQPVGAQAAQQQPGGMRVHNRFNLLPPNVNFAMAQQTKTPVEQKYDAGLMFSVLADSSPELSLIAKELLGS